MLASNKQKFLQDLKLKLQKRNYSDNTIKCYIHYVGEFLSNVEGSPSKLSNKDLQCYLANYEFSSVSKQNQVISSLKFFWEQLLGKKYKKVVFDRPRKQKPLPKLLDVDETVKKIKAITNLKHKAILWLALSTGMRVSEVVNLKIEDVDSKRMVIYVRNGKGFKDRTVPLSEGCLEVLRDYAREYKPFVHLFNGQKNLMYSTTSCNSIMKKYLGENLHFHLLRHTFASHSVDNGTDISVVQKILGHANVNTTSRIYLHLTNRTFKTIQQPL